MNVFLLQKKAVPCGNLILKRSPYEPLHGKWRQFPHETAIGLIGLWCENRVLWAATNPQNPTQKINIRASIAPKFKAGSAFKSAVNK